MKIVQTGELRAGDLLLSMGDGVLSDHVNQVVGGRYSHAALACGTGGMIVEATTPTIREVGLGESMKIHPRKYVHVFRYVPAQTESAMQRVMLEAKTVVSKPYPLAHLVYAYLRILSRVPCDRSAPLFLRMMDSYLNEKKKGAPVTCVELVTRSYHHAGLPIQVSFEGRTGVTAEQVIEFWRGHGLSTVRELLNPTGDNAVAPRPPDVSPETESTLAEWVEPSDERAAATRYQPAREALHLVTPHQLEQSPSFELVGALDLTSPSRAVSARKPARLSAGVSDAQDIAA